MIRPTALHDVGADDHIVSPDEILTTEAMTSRWQSDPTMIKRHEGFDLLGVRGPDGSIVKSACTALGARCIVTDSSRSASLIGGGLNI